MVAKRKLFRLWAVVAAVWVIGILATGVVVESERPRVRFLTDEEVFGLLDEPMDFSSEGTLVDGGEAADSDARQDAHAFDTTGLMPVDAAMEVKAETVLAWAALSVLPPLGVLTLGVGVAAVRSRMPAGSRATLLSITLVLGYLVVAGLTSAAKVEDDPECARLRAHDRRASASIHALLWPVYWPVRLGEDLFDLRSPCRR